MSDNECRTNSTDQGIGQTVDQVVCVLFSVRECDVCSALKKTIDAVLAKSKADMRLRSIVFREVYPNEEVTFPEALSVRPRMVPTLIAFKNGIAALGWEGFADKQPNEIQEIAVFEVLAEAAALLGDPQK